MLPGCCVFNAHACFNGILLHHGLKELSLRTAATMAPIFTRGLQPDAGDLDSEPTPPDDQENEMDIAMPEKHVIPVDLTTSMPGSGTESGSLCNSWFTLDSTNSVISARTFAKQRQRKQLSAERLKNFLLTHNFSEDVREPRMPRLSCIGLGKEALYPIHVAASLGDAQMVRLLAKAGADFQQRTSKGRTAIELAMERDSAGSHRDTLDLLRGKVKTMALREFVSLMQG